ncbi:hypothetical protein BX070DRAFT_89833 [Coemansia spiralis]|nr:hypothetical protein BX070DRAFT_89833 [Coemansia spiralis]
MPREQGEVMGDGWWRTRVYASSLLLTVVVFLLDWLPACPRVGCPQVSSPFSQQQWAAAFYFWVLGVSACLLLYAPIHFSYPSSSKYSYMACIGELFYMIWPVFFGGSRFF